MPIIRVEMFEGRTIDQKKELVKELTNSFIKTYYICHGQGLCNQLPLNPPGWEHSKGKWL